MTADRVLLTLAAVVAVVALVGAVVDRVRPPAAGRPGLVARLLVHLVSGYRRFASPALPPSCRFTPSCSAYAVTALERHGARRGGWLAVRRLLRCGPWHPGGHDPVPPVVGGRNVSHRGWPARSAPDQRSGVPAPPEHVPHEHVPHEHVPPQDPMPTPPPTGAPRC